MGRGETEKGAFDVSFLYLSSRLPVPWEPAAYPLGAAAVSQRGKTAFFSLRPCPEEPVWLKGSRLGFLHIKCKQIEQFA